MTRDPHLPVHVSGTRPCALCLAFFLALIVLPTLISPALARPVAPVGSEIQVNEITTNDQEGARVGYDGAGGFVVLWESDGADGNQLGVTSRWIDSSGVPVGGEFVVNSYTTGDQITAELAGDGLGGFAAVFNNLQALQPTRLSRSSSDSSIRPAWP